MKHLKSFKIFEENNEKNNFILKTANDYDLDYDIVKDIYDKYYPDKFYEKLEEYLKNNKNENCSLLEKKISKKNEQKFKKDVKSIIEKYFDDIDESSSLCDYVIETKGGELEITVRADSILYSIFMKFSNVEKAKKLKLQGDLNIYSGKWNIHSSDSKDALIEFEDRLESISLKK